MADRNDAEREEQVVDQAQHRRQAERPAAEPEPQVQQDRRPARHDRLHGPEPRVGGELAVEVLQAVGLRPVLRSRGRSFESLGDLLGLLRR